MMKRILTWLGQKLSPGESARSDLRRSGARGLQGPSSLSNPPPAAKSITPDIIDFPEESLGDIADGGPGKNVLIRNRYVRENAGTHDTLKILDDSILETDTTQGFDPYNTGRFDRSKSWGTRSRK
jgi:hypothetical protein